MVGVLVLGAGIAVAAFTELLVYGMVTSGSWILALTYLVFLGAFANGLVWVGAELLRAHR